MDGTEAIEQETNMRYQVITAIPMQFFTEPARGAQGHNAVGAVNPLDTR